MSDWPLAAEALIGATDAGSEHLADVWTLAYAAERATLRLAAAPGAEGEVRWTETAVELSAALAELERADPSLPGVAAAVDLGHPVPNSGSDAGDIVARLIRAALADLRVAPGGSTQETPAVARVSGLLSGAHLRLTGRLP